MAEEDWSTCGWRYGEIVRTTDGVGVIQQVTGGDRILVKVGGKQARWYHKRTLSKCPLKAPSDGDSNG